MRTRTGSGFGSGSGSGTGTGTGNCYSRPQPARIDGFRDSICSQGTTCPWLLTLVSARRRRGVRSRVEHPSGTNDAVCGQAPAGVQERRRHPGPAAFTRRPPGEQRERTNEPEAARWPAASMRRRRAQSGTFARRSRSTARDRSRRRCSWTPGRGTCYAARLRILVLCRRVRVMVMAMAMALSLFTSGP